MDADILGGLEAMAGDGRTAQASIMHKEPHVLPAPETGQADGDGMHSALAAIPDQGIRERVLRIALDHQVDRRDPAWLIVETAVVSISAAAEAGAAARLVHEDVNKIPDLIHHAVISGGADISGQVQSAVVQNAEHLARAIQGGIEKATVPAVQAVGKALKDFDSKVDKTIIARKDAVVAQWVQSGSDALDSRVREAIRTERTINVAFMMFAILSALILGIFLGMHLHF
uniref:Uncharacterized protein n=1 Tax=mine drainage metagenome TaxID=410659 RepID=E6Q9Z8_9ZZZZ